MRTRSALVLWLSLVLAAGCKPRGTAATGPSAPAPPANAPARAAATPGKRYRIAVVPKSVSHDFWLTVKAGAEKAGQEFDAEILWEGTATETQILEQQQIIENFITQGVDAIVFAASDVKALIPQAEKAKAKGIPVVTIDSGIESDLPICFVATDNELGAGKAADKLCELIGEAGEVGLIPFVPGSATSQMRENGFNKQLAKHPKVHLVSTLYSQSDVAKARAVTQEMLTAKPGIKGIFAANESSAMGCVAALEAMKQAGKIKLVAFDAAPAEIDALKRGSIQALVVQNPFRMGHDGVKVAIDYLQGRKVDKRLDTGVEAVTMENFNQPVIRQLLFPLGSKAA